MCAVIDRAYSKTMTYVDFRVLKRQYVAGPFLETRKRYRTEVPGHVVLSCLRVRELSGYFALCRMWSVPGESVPAVFSHCRTFDELLPELRSPDSFGSIFPDHRCPGRTGEIRLIAWGTAPADAGILRSGGINAAFTNAGSRRLQCGH